MRHLSLCLLLLACSDAAQHLAGEGEACGDEVGCVANLVCTDGLCGAEPIDAGTNPSDAGQATDAGAGDDAGATTDAGRAEDAGTEDAGVVAPTVRFSAPDDRSSVDEGQPIQAVALVEGEGFSGMTLRWSSSIDGELGEDTVPPTGRLRREITLTGLGVHELRVELYDDDALISEDGVSVGHCGWQTIGDFNQDVAGWRIFGDASRDQRGWLELTGNNRGRKGAIYKINETISPGDLDLAFRISTGQCDEPGPCNFNQNNAADGFAMSIWDLESADALQGLFDAAHSGGGLGFGVGGDYGTFAGNAFHVEFDTWYNQANGSNEFHTDPTRANHIGVALNGDPGNTIAWVEAPQIEDNAWHEIEVVIRGNHLVVRMDGRDVIDQRVEGLDFKGGYIGFSGTTGYYTNYHRFDELRSRVACTP